MIHRSLAVILLVLVHLLCGCGNTKSTLPSGGNGNQNPINVAIIETKLMSTKQGAIIDALNWENWRLQERDVAEMDTIRNALVHVLETQIDPNCLRVAFVAVSNADQLGLNFLKNPRALAATQRASEVYLKSNSGKFSPAWLYEEKGIIWMGVTKFTH